MVSGTGSNNSTPLSGATWLENGINSLNFYSLDLKVAVLSSKFLASQKILQSALVICCCFQVKVVNHLNHTSNIMCSPFVSKTGQVTACVTFLMVTHAKCASNFILST